jgi:methyltransferase (TIGR00027 family)
MIDLGPTTNKGVLLLKLLYEKEAHVLFRDPFVPWFLSKEQLQEGRRQPPIGRERPEDPDECFFWSAYWWVALRERYIDNLLREVVPAGCTQVLSFGCGYDTRYFRLFRDLEPPVRMIETDLSATICDKTRCITRALGSVPDALRLADFDVNSMAFDRIGGFGFDPSIPTAYLIQGLPYYLSESTFDALLRFITGSAAVGSRLIYDCSHPEMTYPNDRVPGIRGSIERLRGIGEPYLSGERPSAAAARIACHGWTGVLCPPPLLVNPYIV